MTPFQLFMKLIVSVVLGAILAVPLSGDELISVETWVTLSGLLMTGRLLFDALSSADLEPARLSAAWTWQRASKAAEPSHPARELRAIKGLIASAQFNPRSFVNRLRPRFVYLANHFLPLQHGVEPDTDPVGTSVLLGDVAWLVDDEVTDRAPTLEELDRFLDIVIGEGS